MHALVTAAVAARVLGRDVRTVRRWVENGTIDGLQVPNERNTRFYVSRGALSSLTGLGENALTRAIQRARRPRRVDDST